MSEREVVATAGTPHKPAGWRCESCRRVQPIKTGSHLVWIEDFGALRLAGSIRARPRWVVRLVVCPPCRRSLLDQTEEEAGDVGQ